MIPTTLRGHVRDEPVQVQCLRCGHGFTNRRANVKCNNCGAQGWRDKQGNGWIVRVKQ